MTDNKVSRPKITFRNAGHTHPISVASWRQINLGSLNLDLRDGWYSYYLRDDLSANLDTILRALGKETEASEYADAAASYAAALRSETGEGVLPLAYGQEGTYSLKYNLLFDRLLGLGLFGREICERETEYYLARSNRFGVPLDTRENYTKSDWILWCAALTEDKEKAERLYAPVVRFLKESPVRLPFGDWYRTEKGEIVHFINRTVQGGVFAPLLSACGKLKQQ